VSALNSNELLLATPLCEEFGLKYNGALGGDSGDKVGGYYLGWLLANGYTTHKNIVTSQSGQNLISSLLDRFLYKWIRTKREGVLYPEMF